MGLPQVPSGCIAEEVAASLGTFVQTAPRITSIGNYELNMLAGEDLSSCMQIEMPNSDRKNVLELSKESHISSMSKDGKSNIQKLKINPPMEPIGRLSFNAGQTMQTPASRTIGFQIRALPPHGNDSGGNVYSSTVFNVTNDATEASESQVRKRVLSPLNGMLLSDHFKGDPLDTGGGLYQNCSKGDNDSRNALILQEYKKVHIGNYNDIHSMMCSSSCFQELKNSSSIDSSVNQIVTSHGRSNYEHEEPWSYKHIRSSPALHDSEWTTKIRSQTVALFIPQKKLSPPFPLSPLGKKSSENEKLGACKDVETMLDDSNVTVKDVEQSFERTRQVILSAQDMPSKSQLNSHSTQQKSGLFIPDNVIDMKEYWVHPGSFPPQHAKLSGTVSRLPVRRSLVGSFEESLLSGRLLSGKISQVGTILILASPFCINFLMKLA